MVQGGGFYLLGVQVLGIVCIGSWAAASAFVILKVIDLTVGLRIPLEEELLGADIVEHGVGDVAYDKATKRLIPLDSSPGFYLDEQNHVKVEEIGEEHPEGPMRIQTVRRKSLIYENGTTHAFGAKLSRGRSLVKRFSTELPSPPTSPHFGITNNSYTAELESPHEANGTDRADRDTDMGLASHRAGNTAAKTTRKRISGSKKTSKRSTGNVFTNLFRRKRKMATCSPDVSHAYENGAANGDHHRDSTAETLATDMTNLDSRCGEITNETNGIFATVLEVPRQCNGQVAIKSPDSQSHEDVRVNMPLESINEETIRDLKCSRL